MRDQKQVCIDSAACWLCEAREHDTTDISGACPTCRADIVRLVDGEPPVIFTDLPSLSGGPKS